MDLAEEFVETIVQDVLRDCRADLEVLERDLSKLEAIKRPFPRVSYDECVKRMNAGGHAFEWGGRLRRARRGVS
jgi:asparaginyl-tRNA synthetase